MLFGQPCFGVTAFSADLVGGAVAATFLGRRRPLTYQPPERPLVFTGRARPLVYQTSTR